MKNGKYKYVFVECEYEPNEWFIARLSTKINNKNQLADKKVEVVKTSWTTISVPFVASINHGRMLKTKHIKLYKNYDDVVKYLFITHLKSHEEQPTK